ncbi:DUF882 domain-containing protein [Pyruvatibacter sp.]|uniref:DUF882 domain-containing protein n=1 Tax=Pyruvatibacter sp. TaxID=1981328 RepID=UPI0032656DAC
MTTRRTFLKSSAAAAVATTTLVAAPAILRAEAPYKRTLRMQSLNSGEKLTTTYWADGEYQKGAFQRISWFMRDLRTNTTTQMSPALMDLLWDIDQLTSSSKPIYTMSAFRSERTNAWLAARSTSVDPGSFHRLGMAIDITQEFGDPHAVYRAARKLNRGGAGYYPTRTPYVHVDVGPVDSWVHPAIGRRDRDAEYEAQLAAEKAADAPAETPPETADSSNS